MSIATTTTTNDAAFPRTPEAHQKAVPARAYLVVARCAGEIDGDLAQLLDKSLAKTEEMPHADWNKTMIAAREYLARRDRKSHPDGKFDKARRWYPAANERRACCEEIRAPSAAWPHSLNKHCRSVEHVAELYSVDVSILRKIARAIEQHAAAKH